MLFIHLFFKKLLFFSYLFFGGEKSKRSGPPFGFHLLKWVHFFFLNTIFRPIKIRKDIYASALYKPERIPKFNFFIIILNVDSARLFNAASIELGKKIPIMSRKIWLHPLVLLVGSITW